MAGAWASEVRPAGAGCRRRSPPLQGERASLHGRSFALPVEMGLLAVVLAVWQVARLPFESSSGLALAHARSWLALERVLHVDVEAALIRFVHRPELLELARWFYSNVHVPAIFAFMAVARVTAADRYPKLRTAFVLAHVPALAVIALYPLAPPSWLDGLPFASGPPTDAYLTGTLAQTLRNSTAAAASMHFGYPVFIAGAALWLAPRSRLAWSTLAYPPLTFLVIVGTGQHYLLDAVVGLLAVVLGAVAARRLHGRERAPVGLTAARTSQVLVAGAGFALVGYGVNALFTGRLPLDRLSTPALVLALGALAASGPHRPARLLRRAGSRRPRGRESQEAREPRGRRAAPVPGVERTRAWRRSREA